MRAGLLLVISYLCVCVFSHRAPLRSYLPLAANLQLTVRLGHRPVRRPTQILFHYYQSLCPIGMDLSNLATDDLAVLSAGSTSPAALRPLPNIPALRQSQKTEDGGK